MSAEECQDKIRELTHCISELQFSGARLSDHLDWEREFDEW